MRKFIYGEDQRNAILPMIEEGGGGGAGGHSYGHCSASKKRYDNGMSTSRTFPVEILG